MTDAPDSSFYDDRYSGLLVISGIPASAAASSSSSSSSSSSAWPSSLSFGPQHWRRRRQQQQQLQQQLQQQQQQQQQRHLQAPTTSPYPIPPSLASSLCTHQHLQHSQSHLTHHGRPFHHQYQQQYPQQPLQQPLPLPQPQPLPLPQPQPQPQPQQSRPRSFDPCSSYDTHKTSNVAPPHLRAERDDDEEGMDEDDGGRRSIFGRAAAAKYRVDNAKQRQQQQQQTRRVVIPPPSVVLAQDERARGYGQGQGRAVVGGKLLGDEPPRRVDSQQSNLSREIEEAEAAAAVESQRRRQGTAGVVVDGINLVAAADGVGVGVGGGGGGGGNHFDDDDVEHHRKGEEYLVEVRTEGGGGKRRGRKPSSSTSSCRYNGVGNDDDYDSSVDGSGDGGQRERGGGSRRSLNAPSEASSGEDTVPAENLRFGGTMATGTAAEAATAAIESRNHDTGVGASAEGPVGRGNGEMAAAMAKRTGGGDDDRDAPTTPTTGATRCYGSMDPRHDVDEGKGVQVSPLAPGDLLYSPPGRVLGNTSKSHHNGSERRGTFLRDGDPAGGGVVIVVDKRSSDSTSVASALDNGFSISNSDDGDGGGEATEDECDETDPWTQTLHAQSFILALAFLFAWSPQNLMAPNLTQMAEFFHFSPGQRDLYLGANIAFATGVLSLPVSALIGFLADLVPSRKILYAGTILTGGVAAIFTGASQTYTQLYVARFVCGGMMSGCVPVAFSLLGDLFDTADRNAASSGLTAMMGTGIILGQVYAGMAGPVWGWNQPFYLSGCLSISSALLVLRFVRDPVRGGKEKVLQDMLSKGARYDRKLTLGGFWHAMTRNESNLILMGQGFFSSVPWGIVFVFLNDYLSQEQGLSVPDATFLVFVFGLGCAVGGVLGGYLGQLCMARDRSYLPLFMSATTFLGIGPYLGLLDGTFHTASPLPCLYAFLAGCIASLPSVNVRPCLINVNPPEARGATLTAANLIINCARGVGPSFITMMGGIWSVDRCFSFNITLIVFWTVTAIQLVFLARSLPKDQDKMETELAKYAESAIRMNGGGCGMASEGADAGGRDAEDVNAAESAAATATRLTSVDGGDSLASLERGSISFPPYANHRQDRPVGQDPSPRDLPFDDFSAPAAATVADDTSTIVSIEDRMTSFDVGAARESLRFVQDAFREIGGLEMLHRRRVGGGRSSWNHHGDGSRQRLLDGVSGSGSGGSVDALGGDGPGAVGGTARESTGEGERRRALWRRQSHQPRPRGTEGNDGATGTSANRQRTWSSAPDLLEEGEEEALQVAEEEGGDRHNDDMGGSVVGRIIEHIEHEDGEGQQRRLSSLRSLEGNTFL